MNLRPLLLGGALSLAAALPAAAHPVTYVGTMSNAGEPAAAAGSLGTGFATVVVDLDEFTIGVSFDFSNLGGDATASHIHCCTTSPLTGSAGVATTTPSFAGFPATTGVRSGHYENVLDMTLDSSWNPAYKTANGFASNAAAFAALATGIADGKAYLNIHSTLSPGGEIRAFQVPAGVPLPAAVWLLLSGLSGFGFLRRTPRRV